MATLAFLKFYTCVEKGLKLNVRKFSRLISKFVEVTREKLVDGDLFDPASPPAHILNRVKGDKQLIDLFSMVKFVMERKAKDELINSLQIQVSSFKVEIKNLDKSRRSGSILA